MSAPGESFSADEPAPCEVAGLEGRSPFVIVCDHASRRLPRFLGDLGLSEAERASHIAWDIGAAQVARGLAAALDATVFLQAYSRLVIDCNRPLSAPDSIVVRSERSRISGNEGITPAAAVARARDVFHPYHDRIRAELDERQRSGRPVILVSVHSFTPVFMDVPRPWHAGVLHLGDTRLALPLLRLLRSEPDLVVGHNEPYAASEASDYSILEHGEHRGIPYAELEIRQDLIAEVAGQRAWSARLARLLPRAVEQGIEKGLIA